MKKAFIFIAVIIAIISMTSCQATPDKVVVHGKNLEEMIEKATTQQPDASANPQQESLAGELGAPQNYQTELSDAMGKVTIHVNADVQVPNASGISVQRVKKQKLSQTQVDTLFNMLMKGEPFSGDDYKPTKDDIQQQILEIQAAQSQPAGENINPKIQYNPEYYEYMIQDLMDQLNDAPDVSVKNPVTSQLIPMNMELDGAGEKVYALSQSQQSGYESFLAYNYDDSVSFLRYTSEKAAFANNMGYFSPKESIEATEAADLTADITSDDMKTIPEPTISRDEAIAQADAVVSALGLSDMKCYSSDIMYGGSYEMTADMSTYKNPRKCVWFLRYARNVNGIPITYTVYDCMKVEEEAQSAPWAYEDMTFAIDDTGIVGFSWMSPYQITDIVTQDSNLISFSEIASIFDTMSLAVNSWDGFAMGDPNLTAIEITVDHIQLGLTRVTEKDKRDSGLLVPAWDFFGTTTYVMEADGQTKRFYDGPIPLLTVNAIDGSIINRNLGY